MKLITLIIILVISTITFSQNPGYFGKYNLFTVKYLPTIDYSGDSGPNSTTLVPYDGDNSFSIFKDVIDGVESKKYNVEHIFQFGYARLIKRNISTGINIGYSRLDIGYDPNDINYDNVSSNYVGMESLKADTYSAEAFISISSKNSIIMSNLSHKFGIRYITGSLIDKGYPTRFVENENFDNYTKIVSDVATELNQIVNEEELNLGHFQFVYGIALHKPLTDFMVLKYGFNLNLSPGIYTKKNKFREFLLFNDESNDFYYFDSQTVNFMFDRALFTNFITVDISLIFPF